MGCKKEKEARLERMLSLDRVGQTFVCKDCNREFIFTVQEREDFARESRFHAPSRCPSCRAARRARQESAGTVGLDQNGRRDAFGTRQRAWRSPRVVTVCASCGRSAEVPFVPREDRPVYCSDCYSKLREQRLRPAS